MIVLADLLPFLVTVAVLVLAILMIQLNRRVSRGSRSAGPRALEPPRPEGLTATPWELEAIDLQLSAAPDTPARRDLVATVNRLIAASRDKTRLAPLPLNATNAQIEQVVGELESRLDIGSGTDRIGTA